MADAVIGYTKGFHDWHKVTAQGRVRDFAAEPGESIGPMHQPVSFSACKLRLANTTLSPAPTDDDPVCADCTKAIP